MSAKAPYDPSLSSMSHVRALSSCCYRCGSVVVSPDCTGGIRCERASALLIQEGVPTEKVFQLEGQPRAEKTEGRLGIDGTTRLQLAPRSPTRSHWSPRWLCVVCSFVAAGGIHRYLESFPDGGHWVGKNYVFDRRFAHGATSKTPEVVGRCACCSGPWDRYQAAKKCFLCRMEVLVCRECERSGKMKTVQLKCFLCGGPKPSYLQMPEGDRSVLRLKAKKQYEGKAEADY